MTCSMGWQLRMHVSSICRRCMIDEHVKTCVATAHATHAPVQASHGQVQMQEIVCRMHTMQQVVAWQCKHTVLLSSMNLVDSP